jgi:iron complex outermembrane receptor protein
MAFHTSFAFAARAGAMFALVLLPAALRAQGSSGTLAGRVTAAGEPVAGAAVLIAGTGRGTQTRADGSYRITVPAGRYEVRTRLIGYSSGRDSATVTAGQTTTLNFFVRRAAATLEAFTTLGTRGQERTVIDAPAPIDVLSSADIKTTGRTETAQMIQAVAPSFNFPRTSIGDGTDHVRPATLRSLAPDQTLVLINGKRRHNSALVNVNGFVGRGSAPVDLNAIPSSMIDRIEILRDGAAAQYGSDAIAGVINVILKQGAGGEAMTEVGQTVTTYNRSDDVSGLGGAPVTPYPIQQGTRSARDGKVFDQSIDYGWSTSDNSFLHLAGEFRDRGRTNRTLPDPRIQYFAGDPRETDPLYPLPDGRMNHLQGDASTHDLQGFWNGGTRFGDVDAYTFGGVASRKGEAAGFWRRANDPSGRRMPSIYPDGFLPLIHSDIIDASGAIGAKGELRGWDWDLATVYGGNQFGFVIKNSMNVSMGTSSPTEFDSGKLRFQQSTTTLDFNRSLQNLPVPVSVAAGAEFRADKYTIVAGETASWINAGGRVPDQNGNPTTTAAPPGAQVFPGFKADSGGKPGDAGSHTRNNTALYLDLSSDVSSKWLVDVAGRFEHYSDFGNTTTGKLSTRYEVFPGYALRGSVSTGFRAPSLMQEFFSSTATNFVSGVPFDIKTFPANTPEAGALGASPLKAERSRNMGFGFAAEPLSSLSITADYYYIEIDDRIVLSNNFTGVAAVAALASIGVTGVSGGRYFTNAIDTRTRGYDIIANYGISFSPQEVLRLSAAYNWNRTRVTRVDTLPTNLSGLRTSLFDRVEQARIESGNPENNLILSGMYTRSRLGANVRVQRYGQVTQYGTSSTNLFGPLDQTFSPKWITDVAASYGLGRFSVTIGADNLFDVYPDRNNNNGNITTVAAENGGTANFGIFPYNGISPFGFNGRFVYAKLLVGL